MNYYFHKKQTKKKLLNFIFSTVLLFTIVLIFCCFIQPMNSHLNLELSMKVKDVKKYSDLNVELKFQCLKKEGIILPIILFVGYEDDAEADIIFELYRYSNKSYSEKQIPTADYNNLYEKQYLLLPYSGIKTFNSDLRYYSSLKNGKYRVRARFIVPPANLFSNKNICSNWIYFQITDMKY